MSTPGETGGNTKPDYSDEGISAEKHLANKKLKAKKLKNLKRRKRRKTKKAIKRANICCVCAKELCTGCSHGGNCFDAPIRGFDNCACLPTCNGCYIKHFVSTASRCPDPTCEYWHVKCPSGCGLEYRVDPEEAQWCFDSTAALFGRR